VLIHDNEQMGKMTSSDDHSYKKENTRKD